MVEVDKALKNVIQTIDLSSILSTADNLQGVAFDSSNNSLWLAIGKTVKNIDKTGTVLSEFDLGKYSKYMANGICVDSEDGPFGYYVIRVIYFIMISLEILLKK